MTNTPTLELVRHDGTPLRIPGRDLGRAWMLYFMRTASCPPCLSHVKHIDAATEDFRALDVEPLIVVPDGAEAARQLQRRFDLRVGVASSPDDDVHVLFGLQKKLFGSCSASRSRVARC